MIYWTTALVSYSSSFCEPLKKIKKTKFRRRSNWLSSTTVRVGQLKSSIISISLKADNVLILGWSYIR